MNEFQDPLYYLNIVYFLIASFLAFFVPGNLFVRKFKLSFIPQLVYSYTLGIVLWSLLGFTFGFLNLRNLSYIYILIAFVIWIFVSKRFKLRIPKFNINRLDFPIIILIVVGISIQVLFTFFNGIQINSGLYFCCGLPDSLYHIALTNSIIHSFPPFEPAAYGVVVKNYHYLSNLAEADFIRVFKTPLISTQYQYFPILITSLIALSIIALGKIWNQTRVFVVVLLIFVFYWGDLTSIFSFIMGKGFNINIPFLYDSSALWFSPPRAFSVLIFLSALGIMSVWFKKRDYYSGFIAGLLLAALVGFKIYAGIYSSVGLSVLIFYFLIKKEFKMIIPIICTGLLTILIFLPVNSQSAGLVYSGMWRFENFISQNQFRLSEFEQRRLIYVQHDNLLRIVEYNLLYILAYFTFVFGTLNICFIHTGKSLRSLPKEMHLYLISGLIASLLLGFFFLQKIGGANTSQFLITAEFTMAIYAALSISYFSRKLNAKFVVFLIFVLFLFTVPRVLNQTIYQIKILKDKHGLIISNHDLAALKYLNNNTKPDAIYLSDNKYFTDDNSCYYVGFMTKGRLYICNADGILNDHGVDVRSRKENYNFMMSNLNEPEAQKLLKESKINYIITRPRIDRFVYENELLKLVYEKNGVRILKVDR